MIKRVFVACEFSATVSNAFREVGCHANSADLLPTEGDPQHHHVIDPDEPDHLFEVIESFRPDLVIAHPPCTYLANSGVQHLHRNAARWGQVRSGAEFFRRLLDLDVPQVAVENPIMHKYAIHAGVGRRQDQVIQPYQFGHLRRKATCLWLKGLPKLVPTTDLKVETEALPKSISDEVHHASPGADRWKVRSRTYPGIAAAMARQWGQIQLTSE